MEEVLKKVLEAQNILLSDEVLHKLCQYWEMVVERNKVMDLTAVVDEEEAAVKHFADSLVGVDLLPQGATVCDLGSGAGFPGIPLAIVRPDIKMVLMDSLMKRVGFLNDVITVLELKNITAVHVRAEDAGHGEYRAKFDVLTARAVAKLNTLLEYAMPLLKVGGTFLAYKGQDFEAEEGGAKKALLELCGKILQNHQFLLNNRYFRVIIEIVKCGDTPLKYPRGQNKPKINPIG